MSGWMLAAQVASVLIKLSKNHNQRLRMQGSAEKIRGNLDLISVDNIENPEAIASILGSKDSMLKQLGSLVSQTPTTGDMFGFGIDALGNILQERSAYKARQTEREEAATARAQMEHFERVRIQTEQLQKQLAEYSEDSMDAFERAEPLLKEERYIEAAEFYHMAIENRKKSIQEGRSERSAVNDMLADNYVKMGFACYKSGMYRRAAESLQEGIKLRPGDSNIHIYLGMSYCKLEKYEEAITHFSKALQQNKLHLTYAYLYYARGMVTKKAGDVVEANKWFDKTIKTLDDHIFDEGMHSSELYLMKAQALLGITISRFAAEADNQRRRLVVKAIRSYTESLKLLSTEARDSIAREEIFILRAQAYTVLEGLIPESSKPPLEFSVRTPLFSGNNKSTKRSHVAGRRRVYFLGRSVAVGADHREAQYEPEREPEDLSDTSDEEVTIRVPTSTTEVKSRLTYKRKDITQNALQDARAAFALNPYSQVALEILKKPGDSDNPASNPAERVIAEENLKLDDYQIGQKFEKGEGVDQDLRRAAQYHEMAIDKFIKLGDSFESSAKTALDYLKNYCRETARDHAKQLLTQYSTYSQQELVMAKLLLDKRAEITDAGMTALMYAVVTGQREMAEFLLDRGADVNQGRTDSSATALMYAVATGQREMAEFLLDRGANVNQGCADGMTALMCAAHQGKREVAEFLLDRGADVNQGDSGGMTALMYAVVTGKREVAKLLLDRGAEVSQGTTNKGMTALMYAAHQGKREVAEFLLDRGADVNQGDSGGMTALMYAEKNGYQEAVELLLARGAEMHRRHDCSVR